MVECGGMDLLRLWVPGTIREVAPDPWPLENEELLVATKSQYNVVEQPHDE